MIPQEPAELVDALRDVVLAVPGVADLHGGALGEAATYLPGRRVAGIRLREDATEVHVSLVLGAPIREVADAVRQAVAGLVDSPVHVTVEDLVAPTVAPEVTLDVAPGVAPAITPTVTTTVTTTVRTV